jgi:glutathione-regulated potassium-efflux system ancillary protein KefC
VSMGVVPVLIKLLERVPESRGGMADLPTAEPVAIDGQTPADPRNPPPAA